MGAGLFVAIFLPMSFAFLAPIILSGEQWKAAQDKARARRIAEAQMNARLLRLDM